MRNFWERVGPGLASTLSAVALALAGWALLQCVELGKCAAANEEKHRVLDQQHAEYRDDVKEIKSELRDVRESLARMERQTARP